MTQSAELILIADDDVEMLQTLSCLLEKEGYKVITVENGKSAVADSKKQLPALILLDIHMPVMDGIKALAEIKSNKMTKHIPVIMLTVEGSLSEIQQAINLGARTYITKPSTGGEILKAVKGILS
ncbi:MAG: response regulator [Elusimicrobia bacterium]|nr:response regulator [Elusimicrobiota bacterium]